MDAKNPRMGEHARASVSIAADAKAPIRNRPILQGNSAMRARLNLLLWSWPWMLTEHRRAA